MNPRKSDLSQHRLRRVIADAVSEKTQGDPHEYATRRWGADRPPPMIERAGVSGTVSGDASPFASESQAFFDSVSADSVVASMPLRKVPFHARLVSVTTPASASFTAEGLAKPVSRMALDAQGLEPRKVASLIVVSDELLRDTQGEATIMNDLRRAISDALDSAFLSTSAATASTPAGTLNGVSITAGGSDVQGSLGALLADFDGDTRRSVFIARASVFASISTNYPRVSLGSNGFLLGLPALPSPFAPADRLILADAGLIAFASSGIEVRASKSANVEMDTAPVGRSNEGESPEGSNPVSTISMFQTNCTSLRVEAWVNWAAQQGAVSANER